MPRPIAAHRQNEIATRAAAAGSVAVEELADHFGVSRETIRRDLKALAARGRLDVVHGGALLRASGEAPFEERRRENAAGKAAIGRAAARLVEDGMVVLLDSGATVEAVAAAIAHAPPRGLTALTTSLSAAQRLCRAGVAVTVLGGEIDPNDEATSGPDVLAAIARFRVDVAFIGVGGLSGDVEVTDFSRTAGAQRVAMLAAAARSFFVADRTKFGRAGPARVTWSRPPAGFIVDAPPPEPLAVALRRRRIPVIVAKGS